MTAVEKVTSITAAFVFALCLLTGIVIGVGKGRHGSHFEKLSAIFSDDCTELRVAEDAGGDIQQATPVWLTVFDLQTGVTVYRASFPSVQILDANIQFEHPLHYAQIMIYHTSLPTDIPFTDYAVAAVQVYCI